MFVSKFEDKIFSGTKGLIRKGDFEARLDTLKKISFHRSNILPKLMLLKALAWAINNKLE